MRGNCGVDSSPGSGAMPITISTIDHERRRIDAVAFGPIHYIDVERHLVEERTIGGIAYKEFIDGRDANLLFALSPAEIRQIVNLVRILARQDKFGATAVVVANEFGFGIMRAMEVLLEDVADVRPFLEERLAWSWLASKPH
jgi:hypothetical protein